jgi:hypothetical protein
MTDLENDPLANDLRAYLSHVAAEPMPRDLQDRAVETPFVRQSRRRLWGGRLGASLLVTAVAAAAAIGLVTHLQRTSVNVPPGAAVPTIKVPVTPSAPPVSTPTASTPTASTPTPSTAAPPPPVDVTAAKQSALALFVKNPLNLNDPQAGYVWSGGPSTTSHFSAQVKARFNALASAGFGGVTKCGEDYISHSQNGLYSAPYVVSAVAAADGSVTVVIHRPLLMGAVAPNLTAVMTNENGTWLATDLASGTGPDASIFSATPNC